MSHRTTLISLTSLALFACAPKPPAPAPQAHLDELAHGTVGTVGKDRLVLEQGENVMFVNLEGVNPAVLKRLHKGETITLLGHREPGSGKEKISGEIDEIRLQDGTRIPVSG